MAVSLVYKGDPRSADFPRTEAAPDARILKYMRSFAPAAFAWKIYDPIAGKYTDRDLIAYTDGTWGRDESDIFLYEVYGLELDRRFVEYVLGKAGEEGRGA